MSSPVHAFSVALRRDLLLAARRRSEVLTAINTAVNIRITNELRR